MAFGMSNSSTRRRELSNVPGDWIGWLEPGVEMDGKMKAAGGLIRMNARFKGEIISDGAVVVHDQGEIEGDIQSRVVSVTGKVKGTIHAKERLEIKEHGVVLGDIYTPCLLIDPGAFFDGQCHMPTPEPAAEAPRAVDSPEHS
ncbi:MAG: bactofilin family protein [Terriglobia bacterium]